MDIIISDINEEYCMIDVVIAHMVGGYITSYVLAYVHCEILITLFKQLFNNFSFTPDDGAAPEKDVQQILDIHLTCVVRCSSRNFKSYKQKCQPNHRFISAVSMERKCILKTLALLLVIRPLIAPTTIKQLIRNSRSEECIATSMVFDNFEAKFYIRTRVQQLVVLLMQD
uniref:Uncharacterized protein n=1 Tax=Glossina brevipalpis TaxID=37001 RepID=A0A1A9W2Y8_9MUSC